MRQRVLAWEVARLRVATAALFTSHRAIINGVASNRIPRGMTPLGVPCSEDVLEALAEAYVSMDMATMTAFHKKAMAEMLRAGGGGGAEPAAVDYEEHLLRASGGASGAAVATSAPAVPVAPGGDAAAAESAAPLAKKAPEKTAFDVTLKIFPAENKIKLIKELRCACGLSIQEAKTAIDKCPGVIARQVQKDDAEKLKDAMVKLGAEVELM
ncbi:ribosomal protein l7/l12-like protein [Leishmania infantum JPCM5]|uniref:Ribosomal_protein_l7/l12-like_protein n=2 Tax=Leishmania infantum TaxID=5671 RepID=A0A6L0XL38_LEIIN|nr:ribosomal protein l7/l12-like protein [Leishmania infantum JPCM5]CAC9521453.1 ribosomal_protein_l7/l12-like_protein [Leishmania infantum]CAM70672.1 ribosomal protein l7/l12-like protein [Leishmania infantum JPCM5]SUZ44525.1 ribosomal_protein_l7/l12-like_protein [Leishmania infantum]|eukprot:XP_001467608.1 ribosomal protein l7/l12-like protein [Leishmania infantum JPCM5]